MLQRCGLHQGCKHSPHRVWGGGADWRLSRTSGENGRKGSAVIDARRRASRHRRFDSLMAFIMLGGEEQEEER